MYISLRSTPEVNGTGERRGRVSSIVITLGVVSLLTDIASESVSAVLPLYITAVLGLSTVAYGILEGLHQGVSALVRIAAGWTADRVRQPKWVAFLGYALSAVSRGGLLIASGFTTLATVITLDRIGKGVRTAPRDAMIAAASDPDALGRAYGVHRMLDTVGAALGPLLAFVILFLIPNGYSTVFVVALAFGLLGLALLGLMVPNAPGPQHAASAHAATPVETPTPGSPDARAAEAPAAEAPAPEAPAVPAPFRWRMLRTPALRRVIAAAGILGLVTIGDGFVYLVLQGRDAFAAEWFPLLYVGTNLVFLSLAVPFGRLADRFGRARVFVIGHAALLAAYVVAAAPAAGPALTIGCLALLGVFYASTDGILAALAAQSTPPEARATGIAAAQTAVAIARLLAATGFGVLWYGLGRETAIIVAAAAIAVAIPIAAALLLGNRTDAQPGPSRSAGR